MKSGMSELISFFFPFYHRKSKKNHKIKITYPYPVALLAPDFPLALAPRGADAMWTTLFTLTLVIAIGLNLAALSQAD
jgi:hypothetical protein